MPRRNILIKHSYNSIHHTHKLLEKAVRPRQDPLKHLRRQLTYIRRHNNNRRHLHVPEGNNGNALAKVQHTYRRYRPHRRHNSERYSRRYNRCTTHFISHRVTPNGAHNSTTAQGVRRRQCRYSPKLLQGFYYKLLHTSPTSSSSTPSRIGDSSGSITPISSIVQPSQVGAMQSTRTTGQNSYIAVDATRPTSTQLHDASVAFIPTTRSGTPINSSTDDEQHQPAGTQTVTAHYT